MARALCAQLEFSNEEYIKAGALLSFGIVNCGVRHEARSLSLSCLVPDAARRRRRRRQMDPAFALLSEYAVSNRLPIQQGSLLGLGMAYDC